MIFVSSLQYFTQASSHVYLLERYNRKVLWDGFAQSTKWTGWQKSWAVWEPSTSDKCVDLPQGFQTQYYFASDGLQWMHRSARLTKHNPCAWIYEYRVKTLDYANDYNWISARHCLMMGIDRCAGCSVVPGTAGFWSDPLQKSPCHMCQYYNQDSSVQHLTFTVLWT